MYGVRYSKMSVFLRLCDVFSQKNRKRGRENARDTMQRGLYKYLEKNSADADAKICPSNQGSVSAGTEHQHQFCYFSTPNNADRDRFRSVPSIAILSGPPSHVSKTLFRSLVISDSSLLVAAARCRLHRGSVARSSALLPRVKVSWSAPTTHFIIVTSS